MKLSRLFALVALVAAFNSANAQTPGTLTLTFTQTPHTSYTGTKNVMAVWIQTSTGTFVKTCVRYLGWGTSDHLPTWAVNAGGAASNGMGANCNTQGATTGATLTSFTNRTITWDGTDVNGTVVADGTYKITVQSTWNHGGGGSTTRSYTFTKGPSNDNQTPASDGNFTGISLDWMSSAGLEEVSATAPEVKVYPNPSTTGMFTMDYSKATNYVVIDLQGNVINEGELSEGGGSTEVNLSTQPNGNYFIHVTNGNENVVTSISIGK